MNNLFLNVINISIICAILIIFTVFLDKILKGKYSRRWIYVTWFVIAIRLIIPFNLSLFHVSLPEYMINDYVKLDVKETMESDQALGISKQSNDIETKVEHKGVHQDESAPHINTNVIGAKDVEGIDIDSNNVSSKSFTIPMNQLIHLLSILWITGAASFLFYHLLSYYLYAREIKRWSMAITDRELIDLFHGICRDLGVRKKINLVVNQNVTYPILIGIKKATIVLPVMDVTKEQYEFIIKHELIHYKNRDIYFKFLLLFGNALHWFNPLVHFMAYLANNDMEIYCDEKLVTEKDLEYREKYSVTLLEVMMNATKSKTSILATGFCGKKNQLKKRFYSIMNGRGFARGTTVIISLLCLTILAANLVACSVPAVKSKAENKVSEEQEGLQDNLKPDGVLSKTSNVLVLGTDNHRYDSILLITLNPDKKKITFTSVLRDMYIELPNHDSDKLSNAIKYGGAEVVKEALESNFDIKIDNTMVVKMDAFQKIIDITGGVEIELSEQEANYLNQTNYISEKKYRNVKPGRQILNGNQALGYARVRYVPTLDGEAGDIGRTTRLKNLLVSAVKELRGANMLDMVKIAPDLLAKVDTDIDIKSALVYLNTGMENGFTLETLTIPYEKNYVEEQVDTDNGIMSVLVPNMQENKKALKDMIQ